MSKPKALKPTTKNYAGPNRNDNLTSRVAEIEEWLTRFKRDADDIINNIGSENLGEELLNRLSRIEGNISDVQSRLTNIENRLTAVENS